jgi:hypothetical protein
MMPFCQRCTNATRAQKIPAASIRSYSSAHYNLSQRHHHRQLVAIQRRQGKRRHAIMEHLLSLLYGISGVTSSALYLPQILKYKSDPEARRSISLLSWGGWIAIACVTLMYALFVVKSKLFAGVVSLNIVAQSSVLAYGLRARAEKSRSPATHPDAV